MVVMFAIWRQWISIPIGLFFLLQSRLEHNRMKRYEALDEVWTSGPDIG